MKIKIAMVDVQTGEQTIHERDETVFEKKNRETSEKQLAAELVEFKAKETAKAAILDRIGLTADELKTILG